LAQVQWGNQLSPTVEIGADAVYLRADLIV